MDSNIIAGPMLVALLRSNQPAVQEPAAAALAALGVGSEQNEDAIIAACAVPLLVASLRLQQSVVQRRANTLCSFLEVAKDAIIAAGAVPHEDQLVALLRSSQPGPQVPAANALFCLTCGSQQNKDDVIAAGFVPVLVAWLRPDQSALLRQAANTLLSLAFGSHKNKDALLSSLLRKSVFLGWP